MDSFTQRMMSRATSRKAEFEQHMNDILREDDDIDDPNLGVMLEARRREYREILRSGGGSMNQASDNFCENKENSGKSSCISDTTKSRLKQLVPLYTGEGGAEAFPSPVGYGRRQTEKELEECEAKGLPTGKYSQQRSKRLAHLATVINNWEDESDKKLPVQPRIEPASVKPVCKPVSSPALKKKMANFDSQESKCATKKVAWDDNVIQSLTMQGFQRCESDQHLVFDYKSPQKSPADCSRDTSRGGAKIRPSPKRHPAPAPPSPARPVSPVKPSCSDGQRFRSESPTKFRSDSPTKFRPDSPTKFQCDSPTKIRSESPTKFSESPRYSMSPMKFGDSPDELRPGSPVKFRTEAPYRSNSPTKLCPESPPRISASPPRHRPQSPVKFRPDSPTKTVAVTLMHETLPVRKVETGAKPKMVAPCPPSPKKFTAGSVVSEMAAKYETESSPSSRKVKDPTELSVLDRKAIFEKNNGGAILPKAPFGMPVPAKALLAETKVRSKSPERPVMKKMEWKKEDVDTESKDCVTQAVLERQKEIEMLRTRWERKREENAVQGGPGAELPPQYRRPITHTKGAAPPPPPLPQAATPNKIRMGTKSPVRGDSPKSHSPSRSPYSSPTRDVHQFPPENQYRNRDRSPRKSSEMVGTLAQVKKIKVSPPKAGRLYPSISDIETESEALETESEVHESDFDVPPREAGGRYGGYVSDSDESAMSFGQAVVQRARLSQTNLKRGITTSTIRSASSSSSCSPDTSAQESRILHEMDDFLDEALGDASPPKRSRECINVLPSGDKPLQPSGFSGSCHSDSFEFTTPSKENKPSLVHTVSTYRKMEAQRTPRKELYEMEIEAEEALRKETPESALVEERIFELEQEMIKQTTIISQATQALNLCHARVEFSGSMEQVEAEKLLLIATSRRMAALHEVERLKVERTIKPGGLKSNADKGSLTIEYISLPIKMCPTEPDKTDYFLCLVTSGVHVQATQVLALKKHNLTRGNRLAFTKPITLENLYCDFTVTIEVFRLNCKNAGAIGPAADSKEDKKLAKLRLTPQKKSTARRNKIPVESPGGPNSVRSPSFKMAGYVVFSLREVKRNKFTLNKVPYGVPLDGTIELSMSSALKSEVEYRGFLTQFEEVSGFGAWKRKWALLKGSTITFWLYPEHEETNKIPIDTVDLSTIKNKEVGLVSREVCARPHTVLLETDCGERKLLSADTLEDRLAWTKAINKSLQLIRAWGGRSY
ncbi:hypothetical protein GE061_005427 [Apolygus lucorum]|uniref:Uncharacterized protein n=1 Tax=Apolygus lucorum TaxID=248454 RepID=A0A6A4J5R1_APOLU|nr:hypothetical protein GE061_005427 [Apolygus lucorum]